MTSAAAATDRALVSLEPPSERLREHDRTFAVPDLHPRRGDGDPIHPAAGRRSKQPSDSMSVSHRRSAMPDRTANFQ
jgi:hypothetical protein